MENNMELFRTISVTFLVLALLFLVASVVLFFVFDIYRIFGILTGRAAKKTILEMEKHNAETGQLRNREDISANIMKKIEDVISYPATEQMAASLEPVSETTVLADNGQQAMAETSLLAQEPNQAYGRFVLVKNEMIIHTAEII